MNVDLGAPWTGDAALQVRTPSEDPFRGFGPEGTYTAGTLVATAADGSTLTPGAANGDPDTFQVDVRGAGTTTSLTLEWDDRFRLPCRSLGSGPGTDAPFGCLTR